jgi:hypothetical protein
MMERLTRTVWAIAALVVYAGCGKDDATARNTQFNTGGGGQGGVGPSSGSGGQAGPVTGQGGATFDIPEPQPEAGPDATRPVGPTPVVPCTGPCTDFPAYPVLPSADAGPSVPDDVATRFAPTDGTAPGPCIIEPEPKSLLPRNWLRPRVHYKPASAAETLFEIRIHTNKEQNDLVAYTSETTWTMPRTIWKALSSHVSEEWTLDVTVRGLDGSSGANKPDMGSTVSLVISPAEAKGSIVYWTTTTVSSLKGFKVGDESVIGALLPAQVKQKPATCLGCHTSTPDGLYAGFAIQQPWSNALASLAPNTVGNAPPFLGAGATAALGQSQMGIQTFSAGHWKDGDHVEITQLGAKSGQLVWIDLEAQNAGEGTAYGTIARNGDSRGAGAPAWNHAGDTIAYVSTDYDSDGRIGIGGACALYTVPYNDRKGGAATPVAGASSTDVLQYYPAFSADDSLLAYNVGATGSDPYNNVTGEVFVIPPKGGTGTRLAANDPVACVGKASPGVTNSWPKWSPEVVTMGGKSYYWLIFSSRRSDLTTKPQLYITAITKTGNTLETHGALYLWNQPVTEANHTPAWDVFEIPEVPPPVDIK